MPHTMNMKSTILILFSLTITVSSFKSQEVISLYDLKTSSDSGKIHVEKLITSELSSTFFITIKEQVAPHIHAEHDEQVFVISGRGKFYLNGEIQIIKKGDFIFIPRKTPHAVKVISNKPLKVISIQTPEFNGTDRIPISISNFQN